MSSDDNLCASIASEQKAVISGQNGRAAKKKTLPSTGISSSINLNPHRRCIFGCLDRSVPLRRFPIHDRERCDYWIECFNISEEIVKKKGLVNLRICLKHFNADIAAKCFVKNTASIRGTKSEAHRSVDTTMFGLKKKKSTKSVSSTSSDSSIQSDLQPNRKEHKDTKPLSNNFQTALNKKSECAQTITDLGPKLQNRKVFMITEKAVSLKGSENEIQEKCSQKRQMYLIIEDAQEQREEDASQSHLVTKIEQVLPQIINRIQASEQQYKLRKNSPIRVAQNLMQSPVEKVDSDRLERSSMILPPKSDRSSYKRNENSSHPSLKVENTNGLISHSACKNINLSADFLFLMKILPKLESIPEPQKMHIKANIEGLIENCNPLI